ncbi:MAG: Lrp/AsnC family transcriptional regulator [Candidatus Aenigmatarchaeota archaeon]|nr:MAG: Lrp/AsnC family transcriptional regulator [Candidatus Aenigmarchaeota archaeon]
MEKQSFEEVRKRKEMHLKYGKIYDFDEYDKKLMRALFDNARKSLAELSKEVGLSRDAIRNRITKMMKAEVIETFRPVVNSPIMGFPITNYVFIAIQNPTVELEERLVAYVRAHPLITYMGTLIGKWDYVLYVQCRNPGEFNVVMKTLRQKFPDIKDYDVYGVLDEVKYYYEGELLYS